MKNIRWHSYIWMILCMAILLLVMPVSGTAQAQEAGGYWELISVDVEEKLAVDQATSQETAENKYAWVLVEILDFENADYWATADAHPAYAISHSYSRGVYTASDTYEGYDTYGQGLSGTLGLKAVFTGMPEIIYPDQPVSLNLSFTVTENSVVILTFSGNAKADFDEWDCPSGYVTSGSEPFVNKDGEEDFTISSDNALSYNETLTAQLGSGTEGERIALRTQFYMGTSMGTNYVYEWKQVGESAVEPLTTIPENEQPEPGLDPTEPATNPTAGGLIARVIVVVGIAIAGTLSTIAGELANKAAQAAASENDEQPTQEVVYVLNPSDKLFNLEVNQPVTLNVNGYRVTQEGYQIEKGALISISLPPEMAEYFSLQTTGSNGQVSCIITLLKIPSVSTATLDVNGVFPKGKEKTQVQLAFKTKFSISPVNTPKITFYEKDKQWRAPELIAAFRDTEQNTPVKVGFYYGFMDPPLRFEPDILEVKESYSSDDGLTYNFKLNVKDGIDLETFFGKDLNLDNGMVKVDVVVKDEKGKEYAAKTELQLNPQLKMIACSYNKDVKTRGQRATPYKGLELDEMEFIADGIDKLPLVIFFIRSDKEVTKGYEAEAVMDIVEMQKLEWSNTASFEEPEVNSEKTGDGFFAYDLSSSGLIAMDKDIVNGVYGLEVDARIRAGGPKNYSFEGNSMRFLVKPQFILLRLWVVPGYKRSTSEAIAYAKLLPSHKPLTGLTLTLETSGGGGATLNISNGYEKVTQIKDTPGGKIRFEMVKGTARWILTYSSLTWSNLSGAQFQVTCMGPRDKFGNYVTASDSFDVNANVTNMLSDLLSDSNIQAKLNNPYFKDSDYLPYFLRGQVWNFYQKLDTNTPYVCHQMRSDIIDYLQKRRHYQPEGDLTARLASMRGMNGIEYEKYYVWMVHVWAGFFLSGDSSSHYKALDPWWEQRWDDPSFNKPENLMTTTSEAWNLSKMTASAGVVGTAAVSALGLVGVAVSVVSVVTLIKCFYLGMTVTSALNAAGMLDVGFSSAFDYDSVPFPDGSIRLFPKDWLIEFIQRLDQQDLNEWRKP